MITGAVGLSEVFSLHRNVLVAYIKETIPQYPFGLLVQCNLFIEQTGKASQLTTFVA